MSDISPSGVPGDEHFYRDYLAEKRKNAQNAATLTGKASVTQTAFMTFLIESAKDQDYRVLVNAPHAFRINSITTRSSSGTCTLTGKINTTALGGTANSVSTTESTQAHTSANDVAVGDDVVLTVSSNSSSKMISVTISCAVTLSA